jgi:type I restriction enzyme R subunit
VVLQELFADPEWDGPIEQDEHFHHGGTEKSSEAAIRSKPPIEPVEKLGVPIVDKDGCR